MRILFKTPVSLPFENIREKFDQKLFYYLSPPIIPFKILRFDGCKKDDEIHLELGFLSVKQKWVSVITSEETNLKGWSFIDEGKVLPWPLSYWKHHHRVDKISENESEIVDDIEYKCSPEFMGPLVAPFLWSLFAIRPYRYKKFFKV